MLASTLGGYITGRGQDFWSHIRRSKVSSVTGTEMSALGQKQTFRNAIVMSALPPEMSDLTPKRTFGALIGMSAKGQ